MQPMTHDSAATAVVGSQISANGTEGLAAGAAAAPAVSGLAPAGAEEVSMQAAAAFSVEGVNTLAEITAAQEELVRAGAAVAKIAGMYSAVDDGSAGTLA